MDFCKERLRLCAPSARSKGKVCCDCYQCFAGKPQDVSSASPPANSAAAVAVAVHIHILLDFSFSDPEIWFPASRGHVSPLQHHVAKTNICRDGIVACLCSNTVHFCQ
jgi:hypothetical protein